jgi:hypothetical protein
MWQAKLFEHAEQALNGSRKRPQATKEQQRSARLEQRLRQRIVRQREDKLQAARQRRQALRQATPAHPLAAN